jgi:hypothetical protein
MENKFIIVIEADNKRAHAAYTKGLEDLDLLWPQIVEHSTRRDARNQAWYEKELAIYKEQQVKAEQMQAAYDEELKRWRNSMRMSPRPVEPPELYMARSYYLRMEPLKYPPHIKYYESIRAELKRMADLAGAALGPYRMTEHQVQEMIAWEDGSRIESIKLEMQRQTT